MKLASLQSTFVAAALVATVMAPASARAQTATIQATATVLQPLTVNAGNNLDVGNVFPGTSVGVLPTAGTAGTFDMNGVANAEVQVSFTLPATLDDGVGNSLTISFAATDGLWNTTNSATGATTFDPAAGFTDRLDGTSGDLFVFLGATVTAPGAAPAGAYSGDIVISAAYTGN